MTTVFHRSRILIDRVNDTTMRFIELSAEPTHCGGVASLVAYLVTEKFVGNGREVHDEYWISQTCDTQDVECSQDRLTLNRIVLAASVAQSKAFDDLLQLVWWRFMDDGKLLARIGEKLPKYAEQVRNWKRDCDMQRRKK